MKKKYFTEEEKKEARKKEAKKYYDKFRKPKLTDEEKEIKRLEKLAQRKKYEKEYYQKNRSKILEQSKIYFKENKEMKQAKNNKRYKERRDSDPMFKLITNIKRNIRTTIKKMGFIKKSKTSEIIGCSFDEFKLHIEKQWSIWMTWDNYGKYNGDKDFGWDIDHIIPLSTAESEEDIIKLNHYTNLQPLCGYINRVVKRDNLITITKENNISKINIV